MKRVLLLLVLIMACLGSAVFSFAASPAPKQPASPPPAKTPATPARTPAQPQPDVEEDKPLKQGDRGDAVRNVQKLLADMGFYADEIDGIFGPGTATAVKSFQAYCALTVDGVVGKDTLAYMNRERAGSKPSRYSREILMSASAYTRFDDGNGSYTCRGHLLRKGLVAVDPNVIPLGTRLYIPGYGFAVADDIGGSIRGNRIDLAFEDRGEALAFGRQRVTVYVLD